MTNKLADIEDLADRLQFVAASIPEPWAIHVGTAATRLLDMAEAGDQLAEQVDLMLAGDFHTNIGIVDALTAWDKA